MDRLLNTVTVFGLVLFIVVLTSLRRAHIRVEYSVSWLGAAVFLLILSRSGGFLTWLSSLLGVGDPGLALVIVVFSVFLAVFYRFSVVISNLKDANIATAQRVAILQAQIESLNAQQNR